MLPLQIVQVVLDVPLFRIFDYQLPDSEHPEVGLRVRVPFGKGEKIGVVIAVQSSSELAPEQLRSVLEVFYDLPPLPPSFFELCHFAATYYQAPLGEVVLQGLPPGLKKVRPAKRQSARLKAAPQPVYSVLPDLTHEQAAVLSVLQAARGYSPFLLYGVTGSGKTEVYLRLISTALERGEQALLLVPEINLTPQLETRIRQRFADTAMVILHSELTEVMRERQWKSAFLGEARIIVGTRLAVFTPLPQLGLIIVDEEHDASYKQQDGMRYSARDLAVFRARAEKIPIVLGSATPSLESWSHAQNGRYTLLQLAQRAVQQARLPEIHLVDTRRMALQEGLSPVLLEGIKKRLEAGEQSLVFLNRRGYAPVLSCTTCGWISRCKRCAANLVVHLQDQRLRCHHCGFEIRLPLACPDCGNQDIRPFGRGTQRLEDHLTLLFPEARILRVDRDSARSKRQWEALLAQIHTGDADILVGTQMLAKGHDFPNLTFVGVVGADAALFAADWRAPERLFAQLMQVAGRAGRAQLPGEVLIQTEYPDHPLYAALRCHDYPGYAASLLQERKQAGFPPYAFQAMLRAEAPRMEAALDFLKVALAIPDLQNFPDVMLYDPVPMRLPRVWSLERAQLLVESPTRPQLQQFLARWRGWLAGIKSSHRLRWHLEVDPLEF